jgi:hypothetical protein
MAKIVTRQDRANETASSVLRFKEYGRSGSYWDVGWPHLNLPPAKETYEKLMALGERPDPDAVEAVMGRSTPSTMGSCDECGEYVATTAEFDINDGEYRLELCADCCRKLAGEIDSTSQQQAGK